MVFSNLRTLDRCSLKEPSVVELWIEKIPTNYLGIDLIIVSAGDCFPVDKGIVRGELSDVDLSRARVVSDPISTGLDIFVFNYWEKFLLD